MKVIDNWVEIDQAEFQRPVIALGNFDGVHLGHRKLIETAVNKARQYGGEAVVLTFNPHPLQVLAPDKFPKLLSSTNQRLRAFAQLGIDTAILLPFTPELAALSPEDFVQRVLLAKMQAAHICVGFNYTFGQGGKGDPQQLAELGQRLGFGVSIVDPQLVNGTVVSSTQIRNALERGDIAEARDYLGHWPALEGIVVSGDRVGRTIGFPTANIEPADQLLIPALGVYAAWVVVDDQVWPSMVNIGFKPTFQSWDKPTIEAHILGFNQDIYDHKVEVVFHSRLRDERKFASVNELINQLGQDRKAVTTILQKTAKI